MSIAALFGLLGGLVALQIPIAFALIGSVVVFLTLTSPVPLTVVVQRMASGLDSFPLLAIPLFVLAGNLMNYAGIASRIFALALALFGHVKGGLAHVNVAASIVFAGMSGVAQADAAGLGTVEIRAMRRAGYDPAFAGAVTAASSIIGPVIPPSVIMVVYAVLAGVSVGDLFLAGILPGLATGLLLMALIWWLAATGRIVAPTEPRATGAELRRAFIRAVPALLAPVILVTGLLSGAATPTELGAITVLYALLVGVAQRELTVRRVWRCLVETGLTTGVLVFIIAAAVPFGWVISVNNLPSQLAATILSYTDNPFVVLAIINVVLLIAGLVLETTAILLIAVPALLPIALALDIDLVHFGVMMVFNLLVGAVTPPFGVLLFIMMDIARVSFGQIVRAMLPFYVPLLVALVLITYWPQMVLFLPRLLSGN